jgi:hypothetical protein
MGGWTSGWVDGWNSSEPWEVSLQVKGGKAWEVAEIVIPRPPSWMPLYRYSQRKTCVRRVCPHHQAGLSQRKQVGQLVHTSVCTLIVGE